MKLNNDEIRKILPHRYPFLLVDKITDMEPGEYAKGIKCVSANEMQFLGHFPQKAVMPGVLILEALAQTGACAILSLPEYGGKIAVFGGVKKCRFRKVVVPGDVLEMSCEITAKKGPVGFGKACAVVDGEIAVDAEISFAISDSEERA
ncbi:MAG: 3-hydroxyacyl-ACP dehydratase FabZ [Eubacterium sp.]|jgi:3-hydroxyacyl-[acyl-carrier-protein] dehydratase|nr:3-hydroxyacyl-ACP dehydratase FabZ [Eubacterium sp.]MCH4046259.1 3-hydroxyacyl-ACP dehydratase FabZ [Eubacterium sp.]MCH4079354.1 3-hydroxyacyl-ACP dehydratase FabZ [Eubacterium sp.]MCH4110578.1 3-hydroxyacyl-ACP dehydratase FabZ [Eubacterium sp.]MCI1307495.1 3-hydroxyacyl-ACP dehydratase FabZ [Eubacterium sp.]